MGYYLNQYPAGNPLPAKGKAQALAAAGAVEYTEEMAQAPVWVEGLVCAVDNIGLPFDAVGYAYNEEEMNHFLINDGRRKRWFIIPEAAKLSGYAR